MFANDREGGEGKRDLSFARQSASESESEKEAKPAEEAAIQTIDAQNAIVPFGKARGRINGGGGIPAPRTPSHSGAPTLRLQCLLCKAKSDRACFCSCQVLAVHSNVSLCLCVCVCVWSVIVCVCARAFHGVFVFIDRG